MAIFIILGAVASIYQLVLLREFTFSIAKNELSLVVAIGAWIIFCSLGSLAGLKKRLLKTSYLPFLYSVTFSASVTLIHLAKKIVGISYYEIASFGFIFISAFIFFGILGFLVGYSFCLFCQKFLDKNPYSSFTFARFFGREAVGFFIGGLIFTFFLASYRNPLFFSLLPLGFYFFNGPSLKKKALFGISIICLSFLSISSFEKIIKSEFEGAQIKRYKGTPYGPVIEAKKDKTNSFYVNGSLVSSSGDIVWVEKFIQIGLSTRQNMEDILFIGPSFSSQLQEILKYNPDSLDYVSMNETIVSLAKKRIKNKEKINFIVSDPRKYLESNRKKYDCIIMNKPPPASLSLNRFYSLEFFKLVKSRLKDRGVFSFFIPSKRDILSPHILKFNSCILNTLNRVFPHKLFVPSDSMIILASKKNISAQSIFTNFTKNDVKADYLTIFHLKDYLAKNRRAYIKGKINPTIGINKDYYPLGFLYYLLLQQAKFYPGFFIDIEKVQFYVISLFIFFSLGLALLSIKKRANYLITTFGVGFASIAVTAFIFIIFQASSGALFQMLGILTGLFMLGLAAGTFFLNLILKKAKIKKFDISIYFSFWVLYVLLLWVGKEFYFNLSGAAFILYAYSFLAGLLTGAVYPLISFHLSKEYRLARTIPVSLYAADLSGAFMGTLAVSVFFIPFLGLSVSLGLVACFLALFCIRNFY